MNNSPFLHIPSLELESISDSENKSHTDLPESPFLAQLQLNGHQRSEDPRAEQFVQMMDELYDEEFEEAIDDLLNEAEDIRQSGVESDNYIDYEHRQHSLTQQYYAPLNREIEQLFNKLIHEGELVDKGEKSLEELESFMDLYSYETRDLTDIQDHWLGGLKKWAKKAVGAVKKGVNVVKKGAKAVGKLASKFGLKFIFDRIKSIALKFLKGLMAKGINLLPQQYRGLAQGIAQKILPKNLIQASAVNTPSTNGAASQSVPDSAEPEPEPAESAQEELNAAFSYLLTSENELEWELLEREMNTDTTVMSSPADMLSASREQFINQIGEVEEGEDIEPKVEQFVQVVLTGLKFALPIVGRQRVMNWLSSIIAKLITKFVGKENATLLSKKMVETGFRMLNLETAPEEAAQIGAGAVAAAVEGTVQQLENFPAYVMDDKQLFERYVVEAFEQAAAANFPDVLDEAVYQKHPWLRESNRKSLLWKFNKIKRRDHRGNGIKVKQLNEVIETQLTPYIAEEIRTYGGIPLATFLRDRMGVTVNNTIPVRVHLFEALPGSRLYDLAKQSTGMQGIGATPSEAQMQYHPLTSIAAGLLMGEPGLGCRKKRCLNHSRNAAGHRYYYLEIPGAHPQYFPAPAGRPVLRRVTGLKGKLDFPANEIRLNLFLGEADAQAIATHLRRNQPETAHLLMMMTLDEGLKSLFTYGEYGDLKIVHPNVIPGKRSGLAMEKIPPVITNALRDFLKNEVGKKLITYLRDKPDEFVQAAEHYSDGVTISSMLLSPPDFSVLRQMLTGSSYSLPEAIFSKGPADVLFNIKPGYSYE